MKTIIFIIIISIIIGGLSVIFIKTNLIKKKYKLLFKKGSTIKYIFLALSFIILSLGIFDIKWGEKTTKTESKGIDIVFVLDVSKSMNALDFHDNNYLYSRLTATKSMISNFVSNHPNDRVGLIIFAGDAHSISPLTLDHDTFLTFLDSVDYKNLEKQGSNIEKAISLGIQRFNNSKDRSKVMIVISDGGDKEDNINYSALKNMIQDKQISTFVVGIGTEQGAKIPIGKDPFGRIRYQTYQNQEVITKLNKDNLQNIAKAINAPFMVINSLDGLKKFDNQINKLEKKSLKNGLGGERKDGRRRIAIISFIFFILYIFFFVSEDSLFNYKK